jgi:hypothetical protein
VTPTKKWIGGQTSLQESRQPESKERVRYLEENMGALRVTLTEGDRKNIAERFEQIQVVGERYAPDLMALSEQA